MSSLPPASDLASSSNSNPRRFKSILIVLVAIALAAAAGVYSFKNLKIDTNPEDLLSSDLPFRVTLDRLRAEFPNSEQPLLVVLDAPSAERAKLASEALTNRLRADTDMFQSVYDPTGGEFFEQHGLLYLKINELEDVTDQLAQAQALLARLSDDPSLRGLSATLIEAMDKAVDEDNATLASLLERLEQTLDAQAHEREDEISWRSVMSGRGGDAEDHRRLLVVRPNLNYQKVMAAGDAMDAIHHAADELNFDGVGVRVRITGKTALSHEELSTVLRGMKLIGPLTFLLVGIVMFAAMRSMTLVITATITLVLGLIWTLGFAALTVGRLNLISMAFGVLYIGLGADFIIHVSLRFEHERKSGKSRTDAIDAALRQTTGALCLCALTTAVGFFSFLPTSFAGVSELGLIAGAGMFINLAASVIVLPALIRLIPTRRSVASEPSSSRLLMSTLELPLRHRRIVLALGAILGIAGLAAVPFATFDADPLSLRDPNSESVSTLNDLRDNNGSIHWSITSIAPNRAAAEELTARLTPLPVVDKCVTIADFIPKNQDEKLALIDEMSLILGPSLHLSNANPPTADQRLAALQELAPALSSASKRDDADPTIALRASSLSARLDDWLERIGKLNERDRDAALADLDSRWMSTFPIAVEALQQSLKAEPITLDTLPDDLRARWISPSGAYRIAVFSASPLLTTADIRNFVTRVQKIDPDATGSPVVQIASGDAIVSSFTQALLTAFAGITLIVWLYFRNIKRTFVVLLPLILGALLTTLVMELTGISFNFANVIALPLLFGVGVDNGIHMVHRSMISSTKSPSAVEMTIARAILYSALTTIAGFGNLSISPHPGTASMGWVLTIGIVLILLCTLIVLPALLSGGKNAIKE